MAAAGGAGGFPTRKWAFGMDGLPKNERMALVTVGKDIQEPTGQLEVRSEGAIEKKEVTKEKKKAHVDSRAWEIATGPGKQFMMTAFMLYMMGSGVHIMNIIFTVYQLINPVKGVMSIGQVFQPISEAAKDLGVDLTLHKLVFIACQGAIFLFIVYRFGSMGLLPTSASDWLAMVPIRQPVEFSSGGAPL
uniref:ER membrane protein complex subunit 4 n=1 Tax=Hemiselmis andersenii TaxID=464988 RepID=A0A6U5AXI6_HEMAN|mmetsp:Transcript_7815/g.17982  ORF Transcript_7815/g.17982 Transcript_7815/m.17982 type:complete len:190 (-) Transcript_7815:176-745(-)